MPRIEAERVAVVLTPDLEERHAWYHHQLLEQVGVSRGGLAPDGHVRVDARAVITMLAPILEQPAWPPVLFVDALGY